MSLKKFFQGDIVNWFILFTLLIQIILLVTLIQKVVRLESLLFAEPKPEIAARIPDEQGHILGPQNAPVTVVEFADFQCPYCAGAELIVKQILSQYPDKVKFVYRHFPLTTIHPYAMEAAIASECANDQGRFWDIHDLLYSNQNEYKADNFSNQSFFLNISTEAGVNEVEFKKCMDNNEFNEYVTQDISDGLKYGVNGTPTFFVNREKIIGVSNLEATILREIGELSK